MIEVMERIPHEELKPWYGRSQPFYAPTEIRFEIQHSILGILYDCSGGLDGSELSEAVARKEYELQGAEAKYKYGDVSIELSRTIGTLVRMAPDNRLYIDNDYR